MAWEVPTRDGYDRWSAVYDADDNPLVALEEPIVESMLGDVRGLAIADIGCGTGRHAIRLAAAGAEVTAVDFSEGMLARARAKPGAERVRFIAHDIAGRLPLAGAAFDRVLCLLVLDHVADVQGLLGELGRVCRPEGFVLVTSMHPAMMLRGAQARFTDPGTGAEVRPASVANQISDYVMGAIRAGLTIEAMSEHAVDGALVAKRARAEKYLGWPMLLTMKLSARCANPDRFSTR